MDQAANGPLAISNATLYVIAASQTYEERKLAGACTRPGCPNPAGDECNECPEHQRDSQQRARRRRIKNRREWMRERLCLRCGGKRRQGRKWCSPCLIREDRARTLASAKPRHKSEPRTVEVMERDGYSRTRGVGQSRRGQQKRWQLDLQDIEDAIDRLQRAKRGILLARDAEEAQVPRVQRDEIRFEACAMARHASRFIDEVTERNGYSDSAGAGDSDEIAETRKQARR